MDLSKLPKLSDTQSQVPPPTAPAPVEALPANVSRTQAHAHQQQAIPYRPPGIGGEIWISLIVGLILAYIGGNFAGFAKAKITHQAYHTGFTWDSDGPKGKKDDEIAYFDLPGYQAWSDMGIFLFGLILLFEAAAKTLLVLKPGKLARFVLMFAILLTLVGVLLNLFACMKMLSVQITPLISGLAVAFGGFVLFDEFATLQRTLPRSRHVPARDER
jgi:hypothetical protein